MSNDLKLKNPDSAIESGFLIFEPIIVFHKPLPKLEVRF